MIPLLLILLLCIIAAYFTRSHWMPKVEELRERLRYTRLPFFRSEDDGSFEQNIEEGLTSSTFDLHQNLLGGGKHLFLCTLTDQQHFLRAIIDGLNAYDWLSYAKPGRQALFLVEFTTPSTQKR